MLHCNVSFQGKCEQIGSRDVDLVFQGHQWVIFTWFMFGSHAFYFVQCFVISCAESMRTTANSPKILENNVQGSCDNA